MLSELVGCVSISDKFEGHSRKLFELGKGHSHGKDTRPHIAGAGYLVSEDGLLDGIHDEPDVVADTFDFGVGFVGSQIVGGFVVVIINERLDESGSSFGVIADCYMRDFNLVYLPECSGSSPGGEAQVDIVGKAEPHDVRGKVPESQVGSTFWQGRQIHLKEIDGEFPVDIVEFELMFILLVFGPLFRG